MNILIGYDGSDHAKAAIDDLRRAGMPRDATAMVVSVGETLLPTPSPGGAPTSEGLMSHRVAGTLVQARSEAVQAIEEATVDHTVRPSGAISMLPTAAAWVNESNEELVAKARAMAEQATEDLLAAGLVLSSRNTQGSPQDILSDEARTWEADCIVVGARGFNSTLERFRAGSVSTALVTHAPCSVEVVRAYCGIPTRRRC